MRPAFVQALRLLRWFGSPRAARFVAPLAVFFVVCALGVALGDESSWPAYSFPKPNAINRGGGNYISWLKLLGLYLAFLAWVSTVDWVSRDTQTHSFDFALWNPVVFFPLLAALLLLGFTMPMYAIGMTATALAFLGPALAYVVHRNKQLDPHERVLTAGHFRHMISNRTGGAISAERKAAHEKGAPVKFTAMGGKQEENQAHEIESRQSDGYIPAKEIVAHAIDSRAEKIMLDYGSDEVKTRLFVDGVWHDGDPHDRDEGDNMLEVFKKLANLNPADRRGKQRGKFGLEYKKTKATCRVTSQGTKTGERAVLQVVLKGSGKFDSLDELGMREKMIAKYKDLMLNDTGIIVLCSLPAGGLSTALATSLNSTDRLLRDFVSLEEKLAPMPEIENVDPTYYDASAGETPMSVLETVLRKQPDVIVIPDVKQKELLEVMVNGANDASLFFTTVRAKEAVEALLRMLMLKVPAKELAPHLRCVLNMRLLRKLCDECKEPFEPAPALLKKLGLPPNRVKELYRHPEEPEKVCERCNGLGYYGRTAIYELLEVNDLMREALIKQPKLDVLRKVARSSKHRTLQEEGILAVVQGVTSLPELMRVLKQ